MALTIDVAAREMARAAYLVEESRAQGARLFRLDGAVVDAGAFARHVRRALNLSVSEYYVYSQLGEFVRVTFGPLRVVRKQRSDCGKRHESQYGLAQGWPGGRRVA